MGLYADAELIWGIPVVAFTDEWDDETDNTRGILTTTRVKGYRGDCWDPTAVEDIQISDKARSKSNDDARAAGLDVSFYGPEAKWWLVASYG
jgi:hypothetical protein